MPKFEFFVVHFDPKSQIFLNIQFQEKFAFQKLICLWPKIGFYRVLNAYLQSVGGHAFGIPMVHELREVFPPVKEVFH